MSVGSSTCVGPGVAPGGGVAVSPGMSRTTGEGVTVAEGSRTTVATGAGVDGAWASGPVRGRVRSTNSAVARASPARAGTIHLCMGILLRSGRLNSACGPVHTSSEEERAMGCVGGGIE